MTDKNIRTYIKLFLLVGLSIILSGCFEILRTSSEESVTFYTVTPSLWANATNHYQSKNIFADILPLTRICAFSIPWIWISACIYKASTGKSDDFFETLFEIVISPIAVAIGICIFLAFFIASICLISYSITGKDVYIVDPIFLFFCCTIILILLSAIYISIPLLDMIDSPYDFTRSMGFIFALLNLAGLIFTVVDIVKLFL